MDHQNRGLRTTVYGGPVKAGKGEMPEWPGHLLRKNLTIRYGALGDFIH
jgi:hypothetical protein